MGSTIRDIKKKGITFIFIVNPIIIIVQVHNIDHSIIVKIVMNHYFGRRLVFRNISIGLVLGIYRSVGQT